MEQSRNDDERPSGGFVCSIDAFLSGRRNRRWLLAFPPSVFVPVVLFLFVCLLLDGEGAGRLPAEQMRRQDRGCSFSSWVAFSASASSVPPPAVDDDDMMIEEDPDDSADIETMPYAARSHGASFDPSESFDPPEAEQHTSTPASVSRRSDQEILAEASDKVKPPAYSPPIRPPSFHFLETFDTDTWERSSHSKFKGGWVHSRRRVEGITSDFGMKTTSEAEFHAIAGRMPRLESNEGSDLILQYEAAFEENLHCGGAYIKAVDLHGKPLHTFDADTDYVIMFGPDRCPPTDKIHCIIKMRNPKTGNSTEHHLRKPPSVPSDTLSHLYTLWIKSNDTLEIWIDNEKAKEASLATDFDPPLLPPKEIPDPTDLKPEDWEDKPFIPDVNATKPEDWDESEPPEIPDPNAEPPEGWMEDEAPTILDTTAEKPAEWNDEEDGPWSPPTIQNPACAVGCGKWKPSMITNPKFKGKWTSPSIPNPNYKGPWEARLIPNKDYFTQELHALYPMDALGFELWTIQKGLLFDNILIGRNIEDLKEFNKNTWVKRRDNELEIARLANDIATQAQAQEAQEAQLPAQPTYVKLLAYAQRIIEEYPMGVIGGSISLVVLLLALSLRRRRSQPSARDDKKTSPLKTRQMNANDDDEEDTETEADDKLQAKRKGGDISEREGDEEEEEGEAVQDETQKSRGREEGALRRRKAEKS